MHTKEHIIQSIRYAIYKVTGLTNIDKNRSLIDKETKIAPVNFLYIFDILENELQLPVCKIFEDNTYEVMCIENLANAIYKIQ